MLESIMECPHCGKPFSTRLQEIDENGNPICPDCAKEKQEFEEHNVE